MRHACTWRLSPGSGETHQRRVSTMMGCWFTWRLFRRTYPWLPLLLLGGQVLMRQSTARDRWRCWGLLVRIDFASLIAIAIDLIQPEFWLI